MTSSVEDTRTPEEIRAEIDATRAALDRTVTEIEHRLQPQHLLEDAKAAAAERVRRAGDAAKEAARSAAEQTMAFGYRTADRVRQSPATAIGVAVGMLAGLFLTARGMRSVRRRRRLAERLSEIQTSRSELTDTPSMPLRRARHPWRRSAMWGAGAVLGACGTYAARRRT